MKIIHLSDTHLGVSVLDERFERIIDDLTRLRPLDPDNHLIIHTGDLIHQATRENRAAARLRLDRFRAFGYQVLLCPGNHDYGGSLSVNPQAACDFQETFSEYIFLDKAELGSLPAHTKLMPAGCKKAMSFPSLYLRDDCAFIGLDSNAAELRGLDRFFAEGYLGEAQLSKLNKLLDSELVQGRKIVLFLHHHPFFFGYSVSPDMGDGKVFAHLFVRLTRAFRRLKDAYSFCRIVRDRAHVLLFGHMHYGLDCSGESMKYGVPLALDGGSTTCAESGGDRMRYRIIDLENMTQEILFLRL